MFVEIKDTHGKPHLVNLNYLVLTDIIKDGVYYVLSFVSQDTLSVTKETYEFVVEALRK